jgi:hypothetical protein
MDTDSADQLPTTEPFDGRIEIVCSPLSSPEVHGAVLSNDQIVFEFFQAVLAKVQTGQAVTGQGLLDWLPTSFGLSSSPSSAAQANHQYRCAITNLPQWFLRQQANEDAEPVSVQFVDPLTQEVIAQYQLSFDQLDQVIANLWQQSHRQRFSSNLGPILRQLEELQELVVAYEQSLEAEQSDELHGHIEFIQEAHKDLFHRAVVNERYLIASQLPRLWQDGYSLYESSQQRKDAIVTKLTSLNMSTWNYLDGTADTIREELQSYSQLFHLSHFGLLLCFATTILREPLDLDQKTTLQKLWELEGLFQLQHDQQRELFSGLQERIRSELSATFTSQASIDKTRSELEEWLRNWFMANNTSSTETLQAIQSLLGDIYQPLELILQTDEMGEVNRVFQRLEE